MGRADYPSLADRRAANDLGEFDFGCGLVPKGLEDAPPSQGGMYRGTTPACSPQVGVSLDPSG